MGETAMFWVWLVLAGLVLFIGFPFALMAFARKFRRGRFEEGILLRDHLIVRATFVLLGGGGTSVGRRVRSNRLHRIHAATGNVEKKISFADVDWEWRMVTNDRAWFGWTMSGCKVMGIELNTLTTDWTHRKVMEKLNLPVKPGIAALDFDLSAGKIILTDQQALKHEWDCSNLPGKYRNQIIPAGRATPARERGKSGMPLPANAGGFRFYQRPGETRFNIWCDHATMDEKVSFIEPFWLQDWAGGAGDFSWSGGTALFYHSDSLQLDAALLLTLLTTDGQTRWTLNIEKAGIKSIRTRRSEPAAEITFLGESAQLLFLALTNGRRGKIAGVRKETGDLAWVAGL